MFIGNAMSKVAQAGTFSVPGVSVACCSDLVAETPACYSHEDSGGRSIGVVRDLAKVQAWVRVPSAAPFLLASVSI